MKLPSKIYVYPPRTALTTPLEEALRLQGQGWRAQYKFNDTHVVIQYDAGTIKLWSRHADLVKNYQLSPELHGQVCTVVAALGLDLRGQHRLDGGLLHNKHSAIKNTIVLWDLLVADGEYLTGTAYGDRFARLQAIARPDHRVFSAGGVELHVGQDLTGDIFVPFWLGDWQQAWDGLTDLNRAYDQPLIEGIVCKDPQGKLEISLREKADCSWMVKSRVVTKRHLV